MIQPQPQPPALSINITPEGLQVITMFGPGSGFQQTIPPDAMHQVVAKWLETHPDLLQQLAKQAVAAKQQELAVIRHIHQTREPGA